MSSIRTRLRSWFTPMRALLVSLVVILCAAIIFRFFTPDRGPTEEALRIPLSNQLSSPLPSTIEIIEEYSPIEVPQTFTVTQFQIRPRTFAEIARLFNITNTQNQSTALSDDKQTNLAFDPRTGLITYAFTPTADFDPTAITPLDKQKAIQAAQDFVSEKLSMTLASALPDQAQLYIVYAQYADTTDDEEKATMLSIPFEYQVENTTAKVGSLPRSPILVYVDSLSRVRKAEFVPTLFSDPSTRQVKSISPNASLKDLTLSSVELFYRENDTKIPIQSIQKVILKKVSIEYRIDPQNGISTPKYRFEGEAYGINNQTATLSFLIPAVKIEFER